MLAQANGYSLEPLYSQIPAPLQGYVELVYDLHNNPSFRLIEPLLYKSPFYDPSLQTLMLSLISEDERPFVLSTPRFKEKGNVHLKISFASEKVDQLFRLKDEPATFAQIKNMLALAEEDAEVFRSFLTTTPPQPYPKYEGKGARWRYFGHACILLEAGGSSILMDPVLSYTYENNISRYTYEDLPPVIDCVLITHNHQDHLLFETLLQLRSRIGTIVVPRNAGGSLQDPLDETDSQELRIQECGGNGRDGGIAVWPSRSDRTSISWENMAT